MAVNKITIEEFLLLAKNHPVLDVRSPGEYAHAHMPGVVSLPLFNDEERAKVGTTYIATKQRKCHQNRPRLFWSKYARGGGEGGGNSCGLRVKGYEFK